MNIDDELAEQVFGKYKDNPMVKFSEKISIFNDEEELFSDVSLN